MGDRPGRSRSAPLCTVLYVWNSSFRTNLVYEAVFLHCFVSLLPNFITASRLIRPRARGQSLYPLTHVVILPRLPPSHHWHLRRAQPLVFGSFHHCHCQTNRPSFPPYVRASGVYGRAVNHSPTDRALS